MPSAAEGYAPNGVTALDYPEDAATGALPLNGAGDTSGRYYAEGTIPFNWSSLPASFGSTTFDAGHWIRTSATGTGFDSARLSSCAVRPSVSPYSVTVIEVEL